MENFVNLKLLSAWNILAVGAIIFFWACMLFVLHSAATGGTTTAES